MELKTGQIIKVTKAGSSRRAIVEDVVPTEALLAIDGPIDTSRLKPLFAEKAINALALITYDGLLSCFIVHNSGTGHWLNTDGEALQIEDTGYMRGDPTSVQ